MPATGQDLRARLEARDRAAAAPTAVRDPLAATAEWAAKHATSSNPNASAVSRRREVASQASADQQRQQINVSKARPEYDESKQQQDEVPEAKTIKVASTAKTTVNINKTSTHHTPPDVTTSPAEAEQIPAEDLPAPLHSHPVRSEDFEAEKSAEPKRKKAFWDRIRDLPGTRFEIYDENTMGSEGGQAER